MAISKSILFNTDSYKVSMWKQYPPGTEHVYSYISARGGIYPGTIMFGLQAFIKEYLTKPITLEEILLAEKLWTAHGEPFNTEGWKYILEEHFGYLPIKIKAVAEGTWVPTGNILVTVENTDHKVHWLTTWVETALLRAVWYPSTVATTSFEIKKEIKVALEDTGDVSGLDFKLHDFGARGTTSLETASLGAMAHLVNFKGTDTFSGILAAQEYYGADPTQTAFSIPAAEHSTITAWGRENEKEAYRNMIKQFAKTGSIYAVVSDSYDIYEACHIWGSLKDEVIASGATLVIRPDSGTPVEVLAKCMYIIAGYYGSKTNDKGYDVLNNVRFIWGDGINLNTIKSIISALVYNDGWSMDNFAFGMGGALLQAAQRDDLSWAMKASSIFTQDKGWYGIAKDPVTSSDKKSLSGRVTLFKTKGKYHSGVEDWMEDELQVVYEDGLMYNTTTFEEVRVRANQAL